MYCCIISCVRKWPRVEKEDVPELRISLQLQHRGVCVPLQRPNVTNRGGREGERGHTCLQTDTLQQTHIHRIHTHTHTLPQTTYLENCLTREFPSNFMQALLTSKCSVGVGWLYIRETLYFIYLNVLCLFKDVCSSLVIDFLVRCQSSSWKCSYIYRRKCCVWTAAKQDDKVTVKCRKTSFFLLIFFVSHSVYWCFFYKFVPNDIKKSHKQCIQHGDFHLKEPQSGHR